MSSTEKMVLVPLSELQRLQENMDPHRGAVAWGIVCKLLEQPAIPHQGDPVALPSCKAKLNMSHDWDQGYSEGWKDCLDAIGKIGPLYTRAYPGEGAQAKKVSTVALREAMENLAVRASANDMPPVFLPAPVRQAPLVMLGGVCVRVSYSGLKWYHDQLIDDRWEPLAVDEFDALLIEALGEA